MRRESTTRKLTGTSFGFSKLIIILRGRIAPVFTPFARSLIAATLYTMGALFSSCDGNLSSPSIVVGIDLAMSIYFLAFEDWRL